MQASENLSPASGITNVIPWNKLSVPLFLQKTKTAPHIAVQTLHLLANAGFIADILGDATPEEKLSIARPIKA